jgi:DNA-binding transcriptional LysR family regulator
MDTELLRTFIEVTRVRNFGKAAENLCVSPSTISARIRQLETQLGLSLYLRGHHKIELTPAGERMLRHARFILGAWESAYEDVALSEAQGKRLVIAGVHSLWDTFLQEWLNTISREHANLGLRVEESTSKRVTERLGRGSIDLGFLYEPPKIREIVVEAVRTVPLILVSTRRGIDCNSALASGYIRVEWGTTFASLQESYFPQRPIAAVRVNTGRLALHMLLRNEGAAYLPEEMVRRYLSLETLHRVVDAPIIEMQAYAAYRVHGEHRDLISELLDQLNGVPSTPIQPPTDG